MQLKPILFWVITAVDFVIFWFAGAGYIIWMRDSPFSLTANNYHALVRVLYSSIFVAGLLVDDQIYALLGNGLQKKFNDEPNLDDNKRNQIQNGKIMFTQLMGTGAMFIAGLYGSWVDYTVGILAGIVLLVVSYPSDLLY